MISFNDHRLTFYFFLLSPHVDNSDPYFFILEQGVRHGLADAVATFA